MSFSDNNRKLSRYSKSQASTIPVTRAQSRKIAREKLPSVLKVIRETQQSGQTSASFSYEKLLQHVTDEHPERDFIPEDMVKELMQLVERDSGGRLSCAFTNYGPFKSGFVVTIRT
jgi:hypothetical protein